MLQINDKPRLFQDLYKDEIDNFDLFFNPRGYSGVIILGEASKKLLALCDGKKTVGEIQRKAERFLSPKETWESLNIFIKKDILYISNGYSTFKESRRVIKNFSVWFHLTNNCNLRCSYCYIHKSPGSATFTLAKNTINSVVASSLANNYKKIVFKFAGGEPLTKYSLLQDVVAYLKTLQDKILIRCNLLTNGTLITRPIANYLKTNNFAVGVSLDGLRNQHNKDRVDVRGKGSFDKVMEGINYLRDEGVDPFILVTISRNNLEGLPEFTDFLLSEGLSFRFSLFRDQVCNSNLTPEFSQLIEILMQCYDIMENNLPKKNLNVAHRFCDVTLTHPSRRGCGIGRNSIAVSHRGDLAFCGMGLDNPFGILRDSDDIIQQMRDAAKHLTRMTIDDYLGCSECQWKHTCAGGCPLLTYAHNKRFDRPSPYCQVYKAVIPRLIRLKGLQLIRNTHSIKS